LNNARIEVEKPHEDSEIFEKIVQPLSSKNVARGTKKAGNKPVSWKRKVFFETARFRRHSNHRLNYFCVFSRTSNVSESRSF
jgi:hypothetical protein